MISIPIAQFGSNMAGVGTSDICLLPAPVLAAPRCSCCFQPFDEWDDLRCRDCRGEELFISRTVINCRDPLLGALYVWGSQEIYLHILVRPETRIPAYQESWLRVIDGTDLSGCLSKYLTRILETYWGCVLVAADPGMLFVRRCQHCGGRFIGITGLCYQQ